MVPVKVPALGVNLTPSKAVETECKAEPEYISLYVLPKEPHWLLTKVCFACAGYAKVKSFKELISFPSANCAEAVAAE
jgi:hypothetical protein